MYNFQAECLDIFDVQSKESLKDKMTLVLISDKVWHKWYNIFELYKNGSLSGSPKSINQVDFGQNKIKHHGSNFFRPLHDLDEHKLINVAKNIINESVLFSSNTPLKGEG